MFTHPTHHRRRVILLLAVFAGSSCLGDVAVGEAAAPASRPLEVEAVRSCWDDLLAGIKTKQDWEARRPEVRRQFLELIRDRYKPARPTALEMRVHETADVDGVYTRQLVSYEVGEGERAHAYLAIPKGVHGKGPAVLVLHGTTEHGKEEEAGLSGDSTKAYLNDLARRGYVVLAPDHFVAGHRVPPEGPYVTQRFYEKHPEWTAVGKFTFEHSIAVDLLCSLPEVDAQRIGVMGHSLGGQGTLFLMAYDERVACGAANCTAAAFRQNPKALEWARDRWYVYFKHLRPELLAGRAPAIDFHHIMALAAPRPLLEVSAINDGDRGTQKQRVLMLMAVSDVYQFAGAPPNFAFYVNGYGHASPVESRAMMYAWMDEHLKASASKK